MSSPATSPPAAAASPTENKAPPSNQFDIHNAAMENVFIGISGLIGAGKVIRHPKINIVSFHSYEDRCDGWLL
jgi:hypothetical protein